MIVASPTSQACAVGCRGSRRRLDGLRFSGGSMIFSARFMFLAMLFPACAPSNTERESNTAAEARAATFVYAPVLNRPHQERMRRIEEFSIPGSPLRNVEEWVMDWVVVVHQETN